MKSSNLVLARTARPSQLPALYGFLCPDPKHHVKTSWVASPISPFRAQVLYVWTNDPEASLEALDMNGEPQLLSSVPANVFASPLPVEDFLTLFPLLHPSVETATFVGATFDEERLWRTLAACKPPPQPNFYFPTVELGGTLEVRFTGELRGLVLIGSQLASSFGSQLASSFGSQLARARAEPARVRLKPQDEFTARAFLERCRVLRESPEFAELAELARHRLCLLTLLVNAHFELSDHAQEQRQQDATLFITLRSHCYQRLNAAERQAVDEWFRLTERDTLLVRRTLLRELTDVSLRIGASPVEL